MKKLSYLFALLGLGGMLFIASCSDDDDDPPPAAPSVTAPSSGPTVQIGTSTEITFSMQAAGGFQSASATPAGAVVTTSPAVGALSGDVVVTFTAGTSGGTETVTLTVTDQNNLTGQASVDVTVSESAIPAIAGVPPAANIEAGDELGPVIVELTAEDGLAKLTITKNGEPFAEVDYNGETSMNYEFRYTPTPEEASRTIPGNDEQAPIPAETITFEFVVEDNDEDTDSFTHELTVDFTLIRDDDIQSGTYDWVNTRAYLLEGLVFLESGGRLNIEEGTIVKFIQSPADEIGDNTSALIIAKGAQIFAEGTSDEPIILTAELDDFEEGNLLPTDNTQWGGLVVLGDAPVEKDGATTNIQIEGIDSGEPRGIYGGSTAGDDSGIIRYVSIRYSGVGLEPGNEIQGLSLGGVGNGTTIEYVDIFSSADDGIEIFGGTVNIKYVSVAFSTDDDFDFDLGWRGNGQFLFSLMLPGSSSEAYDHAGEWDGASPDDASLFSAPNISNWTAIGPGQNLPQEGRERALLLRENFAGKVMNSIFEDYPGEGITVEDVKAESVPGSGNFDDDDPNDSYATIGTPREGFQLEILNNTWAQFAQADAVAGVSSLVQANTVRDDAEQILYTGETADVVAELEDNSNKLMGAVLMGISRTADGGLDPRPSAADPDVADPTGLGMDAVTYRGAFDPSASDTWLSGWSTLAKFGYLGN